MASAFDKDEGLMTDLQQKYFIIFSIVYSTGIVTPLLIYKAYQLRSYKFTNEYKKRHPMYLKLLYGIVMFHIVFQQPFCLLILYPSTIFFPDSNFSYSALTGGIVHIFGFFVILGFFLLFLSRSWILYHDYRFNDSIANLCWRLEIQPTYKNDNWWISKRSIYGNPKYILLLQFIAWILLLTLYVVLYFTIGDGASSAYAEETDQIMEWIMAGIHISLYIIYFMYPYP